VAAALDIRFVDPTVPASVSAYQVSAALETAFKEWTRHFDYTVGSYVINVSLQTGPSTDASLAVTDFSLVGTEGKSRVIAPSFGLAVAGRAAAPIAAVPTLFLNPGLFTANSSDVAPILAAAPRIERELGHALGITAPAASTFFVDTFFSRNPQYAGANLFTGPNAQVTYGGPVPLAADRSITTVGGGGAVMTSSVGANSVQPLDVALLRDAGLPALTDQELTEHEVARLYFGAFGRVADSAGLIQHLAPLRSLPGLGLGQIEQSVTLFQIADDLTTSPEFTTRYGALSDADFIRTIYQNTYGRQPDDATVATAVKSLAPFFDYASRKFITPLRGGVLFSFTNTDEARGRLSANANVTYAATAEAQAARLYDTAFGRDADPAGFNQLTKGIINGLSLQQAAIGFLGSAEFAGRYGAAPSDTALVEALYRNTLRRAPDAAGEAQYLRALASGSFSRADLLATFSDSTEHINLVSQRASQQYDANLLTGSSSDIRPHLGIIPVIGAATYGGSYVPAVI